MATFYTLQAVVDAITSGAVLAGEEVRLVGLSETQTPLAGAVLGLATPVLSIGSCSLAGRKLSDPQQPFLAATVKNSPFQTSPAMQRAHLKDAAQPQPSAER